MASSVRHENERRAAGVRRVPVERIVDVCSASAASAPAFQGWSMDVSGRGMSVRAAHLPELAAPLVVRFQEHGSEVIAEGIVVWRNETSRGAEFGVRFTALDSRSVQALKELCQAVTLRSAAPEPPPGIFDVPDEPHAEEHDTERAPPASSSVNLHIEGMAAPMQAQVRQQGSRRLALGSQLEFLRVGRNVEVEDMSLGDRRAARIDAVDVAVDPESRVPELVVSLCYDGASAPPPSAAERPSVTERPSAASNTSTPPMPSGTHRPMPAPSAKTPSVRAAVASTPAPVAKAAPLASKTSAPVVKTTAPVVKASAPAASPVVPLPAKPEPLLAEPALSAEPEPTSPAARVASAEPTTGRRSEPKIVLSSRAVSQPQPLAASESDESDDSDVPLDQLGVPVDEDQAEEEQDDALSEPFRRLVTKAASAEDDADDELPPSRPSLEIEEHMPSEAERLRQRLDGVLDGLSSAARLAGERCRSFGAAATHGARSVAERARRAGQQALAQRAALPRRRTAAPPRSLRNTGARTLPRSLGASVPDATKRPRVSQRALLGGALLGIALAGTCFGLGRGSSGAEASSLKPAAVPAAVRQSSPLDTSPAEPSPAQEQRPRILLPPEEGEPEDVTEPSGVVAQVPLFGPTSLEPAGAPGLASPARERIEKRALARLEPAGDAFERAPRAKPRREPAPRRKSATPPEFRSGRLELPIVHRLRLDQPADNLRGERTPTGFDVIVPGRKTMESGNAIARRDHRIAKVTTRNGSEGTRVSFRFRSDIPAYKVRLRKDYIEFFLSSD
jgi:hypothetical protein